MLKDNKNHNKLWDFKIMEEIGRGETGIVYRVRNRKTDTIQALKKIPIGNMTTSEKNQTYRELKTLQKLNHPNVIRYHQSFISAQNLYIVMDYANKGDLLNIFAERRKDFNHFKETELWEIFQQLAAGLNYLHQQKIIHRDLKLQNIFVHQYFQRDPLKSQKKQFLIGDLGLSKLIHQKSIMESKRVGTPIYFAPEMIQHLPYSFEVDLWALGCVFYSLANLKHPFQHAILENLADIILVKPLKPIKSYYSKKVCIIVQKLLQKNPSKRINSRQLLDAIKNKPMEVQTVRVFNNKYYSALKNDAEQVIKLKRQMKERSQSTNRDNKLSRISCQNEQEKCIDSISVYPIVDLKQLFNTVKCMRPSSIRDPYKQQSLRKYQQQFDISRPSSARKGTPSKVFSKNKAFRSVSRPMSATFKKSLQNDFIF